MCNSTLYDEKKFYQEFIQDLLHAREEIIESPFITTERAKLFRPIFKKLIEREIKIFVITRDPREHEGDYRWQSEEEVLYFEYIGVQALLCVGNHHRKLAILDRNILWEGSLNILSQTESREIMRRIEGSNFAKEMFNFLNFGRVI